MAHSESGEMVGPADEQLIDRRLTIRWGPEETAMYEKALPETNGLAKSGSAEGMASLHGNSVRDQAGRCRRVAGHYLF